MRLEVLVFAIASLIGVANAVAAPIPNPVTAMITQSAKSPETLKTVSDVAKATYPDSAPEIDALVASLKTKAAAEHEEKLAHAGIFDAWSGSGQVGFSKTTGNTDDTSITVGLKLTKDGLKFRHKLNAQVDRETTSSVLTRNRYMTDYELDYKFNDRLYVYGLGGWDRDTFAGFTHRLSESVGLGYSVLKSDALHLDLTAGPALRQTRYITGITDHTTTGRGGIDFAWKIRDGLTFTENAGIFLDGTLNSTTALTTALSTKVSARVSFDVSHEDKVPAGRVPTDTATRLSLVYGF